MFFSPHIFAGIVHPMVYGSPETNRAAPGFQDVELAKKQAAWVTDQFVLGSHSGAEAP